MFSKEIKDFSDIENDEKELEKYNNMLVSAQGNTARFRTFRRRSREITSRRRNYRR